MAPCATAWSIVLRYLASSYRAVYVRIGWCLVCSAEMASELPCLRNYHTVCLSTYSYYTGWCHARMHAQLVVWFYLVATEFIMLGWCLVGGVEVDAELLYLIPSVEVKLGGATLTSRRYWIVSLSCWSLVRLVFYYTIEGDSVSLARILLDHYCDGGRYPR